MGSHRRAMGGCSCCVRYHSTSTCSPALATSSGWCARSAGDCDSPLQMTYGMWSPVLTVRPARIMAIATRRCGSPLASGYSCGALVSPLVITNLSNGMSPRRAASAVSDTMVWISSTMSSRERPDSTTSSTRLPTSRERMHQSRRTRSRPLASFSYVTAPPLSTTVSAAYFFFLSRSMVLKIPSMSISSSRYSLFTSRFTCVPIARTRSRSSVPVLIMIESVSP
mmetsp:Transcript_22233/g.71542  ORF Transcript_22233/g.71542 Transcript_22233/m.71542 type:complete len:224 (-) Transcript_22233:332-1003(-)